MTVPEMAVCMPDHIHWFSQVILDYYLSGTISTQEFMRWFHMPNSEYLTISECIVARLDPHYDPLKYVPGVLDGFIRSPG
jgi:hypothetical protein